MKILYSERDQQRVETFIEALTTANTKAATLSEQNKVLQVQLDFMRLRVNQLEMERAALLNKATGITLPVPQIVPRVDTPDVDDLMKGMASHFEDVGDDEAERLGIINDPTTGEVRYKD